MGCDGTVTDNPKTPKTPQSAESAETPQSPEVVPTSEAQDSNDEARTPIPAGRLEPGEIVGHRRGMFGVGDTGDTSGYGGLRRTIRAPGASTRPYGEPGGEGGYGWFDEVADELDGALDEQAEAGDGVDYQTAVHKVVVERDEITFYVHREHLPQVARTLRDDPALRFELCTGVSGVHYPEDTGRELHAVYHLRSLTHNRMIRVETSAPDNDPHMPSLVSVYPTNDWHERETYDFFGLIFDDHPALARIMMPDDWVGHPQRKDYPLGGIPVEYKGAQVPAPDQRRAYS